MAKKPKRPPSLRTYWQSRTWPKYESVLYGPVSIVQFFEWCLEWGDESEVKIMPNEFISLEGSMEALTTSVIIDVDLSKHSPETIDRIKELADKYKGNIRVEFSVRVEDKTLGSLLSGNVSVKPDKNFFSGVNEILGLDSVRLKG